ncbi:hypothetical protein VE03_01025 [Pseudogymnoascus sp. 23342-1-I1]|nr:hypothetical protein VE03_01025 [Pseudogymnoascus sp. 23342-1-I1]
MKMLWTLSKVENSIMENVKDSTFINLAMSIDDIQRAVNTPKRCGVRNSIENIKEMEDTLRKDIISVITSPLSQIARPQPVPGLSAKAIEAIRSLYSLIKSGQFSDQELEASVMAAVKEMRQGVIKEPQDGKQEQGSGDSSVGDNGA